MTSAFHVPVYFDYLATFAWALSGAIVAMRKRCDIVGVFWGDFVKRQPGAQRANMERLLGWVAEGRIRAHVHAEIPLERWTEAYALIGDRKARGKIVLTL